MDWIAIVSGFGVGAIAGLTGVGGGSPTTPLLSAFKLNPAVAIDTDLRFAAVTKAAGPVSHHQAGHVQWRITGLLLADSLPASLATIALMHHSGLTQGWTMALTFSLGVALLLTAVTVAYQQAWQALGLRLQRRIPERRKPLLTVLCGLILGAPVSLSSIGAGAIGATLILLSYGLLTLRRLGTESASYQWMNLAGAAGLIVNGAWNGAFPSVFLNVVWLAIALYALARPALR